MARSKFEDRFYLRAYLLTKGGMPEDQVAEALGVSNDTLDRWKAARPAFAEALAEGRKERAAGSTFRDFVYGRLSPEMREVLERIDRCEGHPLAAARIDEILADKGEGFRKHLFVHVLIFSNFDASEACRRVNVSYRELCDWRSRDEEFSRLIDEVRWHKGNFIENHLLEAVANGEPTAVIFASKTFNRDRGYNDRKEVVVDKTVTTTPASSDILPLDLAKLSFRKKKAILAILEEPEPQPLLIEARDGREARVG